MNSNNPGPRGWPRGFGALNSSSHSWIFTSVSVSSSPRSYLFTSARGRIGFHTPSKYGTKPPRYVTLHFRDRRGFAPSDIAPKSSSLSVNRRPIRYDFCGGAKAIRYSVEVALISKTTTLRVHHTFWYISLPSLHHYDVKLPNLKFYGELKQMTKKLDMVLKNSGS